MKGIHQKGTSRSMNRKTKTPKELCKILKAAQSLVYTDKDHVVHCVPWHRKDEEVTT
jgi:hypothetical protein